jgi:hydrogenase maturation factor HypF (carbamoyltransferase family)
MLNSIPLSEQSKKRECSKCGKEMRVAKQEERDSSYLPYFANCVKCGTWFDIYIL